MDQRPIIPIPQLINTIHAPHQYEHNSQRHERHKHLKRRRQRRLPRSLSLAPPIPKRIVRCQGYEHHEREHLEHEARFGYRNGDGAAAGGQRGQCSAGGLQAERKDVAGDEDPVVELWGEAPVLAA